MGSFTMKEFEDSGQKAPQNVEPRQPDFFLSYLRDPWWGGPLNEYVLGGQSPRLYTHCYALLHRFPLPQP